MVVLVNVDKLEMVNATGSGDNFECVKKRVALAKHDKQCTGMMVLSVSLIVFLFPLAYSPGPGNMFFAANGARFGFSHTLAANAGYHVATLLVTLLIGVFYQAVLKTSPEVFFILKIFGVIYVLYLAWKLATAGALVDNTSDLPARRWSGFWIRFAEGMVLLVLNPKAYLIIILIFSQFLPTGSHNNFNILAVISVVFTLNNLIAFSVWAYAGDRLASKFRDTKNSIRLNRIFGFVLVLVAFWMLIA